MALRVRRRSLSIEGSWHDELQAVFDSGDWDSFRGALQNYDANNERRGFWRRGKRKVGLLAQDAEGRTPLHSALLGRTPNDVLLLLLRSEPKAASFSTRLGHFPLHLAVLYEHHIEVIAALVDAYPSAMSAVDKRGYSPLGYAFEHAKRSTDLKNVPHTYWMPINDYWQNEQSEKWAVVHWLLLSSAMFPQTSLSIGGKKPMLVEALLCAAPPAVISLLIGASSTLLSFENHATAFAGSTLYSCITRHYPWALLVSLASRCPKDVRRVRDETGMGLVSAQFIAGCFQQSRQTDEWTLDIDFYSSFLDAIESKSLDDASPELIDWWKKIHYLIVFCSNLDPSQALDEFLLHAALGNPDTPPPIIRMILTLYPQAMLFPDPTNGASPIHLACMNPEYMPRHYERQVIDDSTIHILVKHEASCVLKRWHRRLPLHVALESGKMWPAIEHLVKLYPESLKQRDPVSKLYPFLQAAAYQNRSEKDSIRWTCMARNQYSYAVWKGLSDKQKASAVLRIVDVEEKERISTVYELLRRNPAVIHPPQTRAPIHTACDCDGVGMIASHYISWCYEEVKRGKWVANVSNIEVLREAIRSSSEQKALMISIEFEKWWCKMKFWIRYCFPGKNSDGGICDLAVLPDEDCYLLHGALANSDTPPQIVELLLSFFPESVYLPIPETQTLPLHIASATYPYTPRPFETVYRSTLELTLKAFPEAAILRCNGRLPLHIAMQSGKTYGEVKCLIDLEPKTLKTRDSHTLLYPVLQMAAKRPYVAKQSLRFHYVAKNGRKPTVWDKMTPQDRTRDILRVRKLYQLDILSSLFEIIRLDPSVIECRSIAQFQVDAALRHRAVESFDTVNNRIDNRKDDVEESPHLDEGEADQSEESDNDDGKCLEVTHETALMRLLSSGKESKVCDDIFECDASVLSNIDVMSAISSTIHNDVTPFTPLSSPRNSSRRILDDTEEGDEDNFSGSMYEFAEESIGGHDRSIWGRSGSRGSIEHSLIDPSYIGFGSDTSQPFEDNGTVSTDTSSLVLFQLRRKPRMIKEEGEVPFYKLRKKELDTNMNSSDNKVGREREPVVNSSAVSVSSSNGSIGQHILKNSIRSRKTAESDVSLNSSFSDSYKSLDPNDLTKSKTDMMWVGSELNGMKILGSLGNSENFPDDPDLLFAQSTPTKMEEGAIQAEENRRSHPGSKINVLSLVEDETSTVDDWSSKESEDNSESSDICESDSTDSDSSIDMYNPIAREGEALSTTLPFEEEVYFDKENFKWMKRPRDIPQVQAQTISDTFLTNKTMEAGHDKVFDRSNMRWVSRFDLERNPKESVLSHRQDSFAGTDNRPNSTPNTAYKPLHHSDSKQTAGAEMPSNSVKENVNYSGRLFLRCLICRQNGREVLMVPCKHLCICYSCSSSSRILSSCPICQGPVSDHMVIF